MQRELRRFFGFELQSDHVKDYIDYGNMKSAIYMATVIIAMNLWVMVSHIINIANGSGDYPASTYFGGIISNTVHILFSVYIIYYSEKTYRNRTNDHKKTTILFLIYTILCLVVGLSTTYYDYVRNEHMFAFSSITILALCLLAWHPMVILGLSTGTFLILYMIVYAIDGAGHINKLNFFTMWICLVFVAFSHYRLRFREARKDENLERANTNMKKSLMTDELTDIANMYAFREKAPRLLKKMEEQADVPVFLYIDIENFKNYNESYGFNSGDKLLRRFAKELEKAFDKDMVARISDDHFVVLTVENRGRENANYLRSVLHSLQEDVRVEMKIGVYAPEGYDEDVNLACDRARIACQSVKKNSEKHFRYYDKKMEEEMMRRRAVVNSIDSAIEKDHIKVYYQPIVNLNDNKVCGMEALARWEDPKYGTLSPGVFIDVLEEYKLIHKLDLCMVDHVCKDLSNVIKQGHEPLPVSINFSRYDFDLCDMVFELKRRTSKYGIDPKYIDIEITETALSDSAEDLKLLIELLHDAGFRLWLDDFGSGYSSLNVLKDYNFDLMKIDMQFINGIEENDKAKPILNNVVRMAHEVSMRSLTEGVETRDQADYLKLIGCERAQGYYFSKPMVLKDMDAHLKEKGFEYADGMKAL